MQPRDPESGATWLSAASAALHLALAVLVAGSAVLLLLKDGDEPTLAAAWAWAIRTLTEGLAAERRRPYALALVTIAAALPVVVGWWDGQRVASGRSIAAVGGAAALGAVASVMVYVAAVYGITHARGVYVTIIARAQLSGSYLWLGIYGLLYVPLALMAASLLRRWLGRSGVVA